VLHYEKRAPLPVINLLRTDMIDRGIERSAPPCPPGLRLCSPA